MQTIGFGWDPESNTVNAIEDVWKTYLEKYPKRKKYKKKGLAKYDVLFQIFGGILAIGKWAMGPCTVVEIGGATNKSVQEIELKKETRDSNDILNAPPAKVSKGGSGRSKKKSATKSLVESVQ